MHAAPAGPAHRETQLSSPAAPWVGLQEMKAAYYVHHPLLLAYTPGMLYNAANPCVGAPGDDHQPVAAAVGEGAVVQQSIILGTAGILQLADRRPRLEIIGSRDLAKED